MTNQIKKNSDNNTEKDIKKLVIERLKASSDELEVIVGDLGDYSKEDLIKSVEKGDELGKEVIEMEMSYLKAIAEGKIYPSET